ncbi:hypothetical protein JXO59_07245 [candidate division KSB1 bacterium]|nr:hypothetical protein [candidate division KSB1 bacterium]
MRYLRCAIVLVLICCLNCEEKLPARFVPPDTLSVSEFFADQYFDLAAGGHCLRIYLAVENIYHETLQDTARVRGQVRIWWKKYPEIIATLSLKNQYIIEPTPINGNYLTLDPGDKCHLRCLWPMLADDGRYVVDLMDFSDSLMVNNLLWAEPDTFLMKAQVQIFKPSGYVQSGEIEAAFTAWKPLGRIGKSAFPHGKQASLTPDRATPSTPGRVIKNYL